MTFVSSSPWTDSDAEEVDGGLAFRVRGQRWFLPHHGIFTSTCEWWAHYVPQHSEFYAYRVSDMRDVLQRRGVRAVYTPRKADGPPTNRGLLFAVSSRDVEIHRFAAHESFLGSPLLEMPRGKAGKIAELHFVGTVYARSKNGGVDFADAWQDQKGNDVQLENGEWVQVKLDRGVDRTGNLYIQTHTRTKGTAWLEAV